MVLSSFGLFRRKSICFLSSTIVVFIYQLFCCFPQILRLLFNTMVYCIISLLKIAQKPFVLFYKNNRCLMKYGFSSQNCIKNQLCSNIYSFSFFFLVISTRAHAHYAIAAPYWRQENSQFLTLHKNIDIFFDHKAKYVESLLFIKNGRTKKCFSVSSLSIAIFPFIKSK